MCESGIYQIRNLVNNKIYVGSAVVLKKRFSGHKSLLNGNKSPNTHLQNAWNKHGEENFEFKVIDIVSDEGELIPIEQAYLDFFDPDYNICKIAGNTSGRSPSKESRKRVSDVLKGRKFTEEHKRKISESRKGEKHPLYGKSPSKETRIKISKSNKGLLAGEKHPFVKLNDWKVRVIRQLLKFGKLPHKEIAMFFGVGTSTISAVSNGQNWRHI